MHLFKNQFSFKLTPIINLSFSSVFTQNFSPSFLAIIIIKFPTVPVSLRGRTKRKVKWEEGKRWGERQRKGKKGGGEERRNIIQHYTADSVFDTFYINYIYI